MTATLPERGSGSAVSAQCPTRDVYLQMVAGADREQALRSFRTHHPLTPGGQHVTRLPAGWRVPFSAPGALSQ